MIKKAKFEFLCLRFRRIRQIMTFKNLHKEEKCCNDDTVRVLHFFLHVYGGIPKSYDKLVSFEIFLLTLLSYVLDKKKTL